MFPRALPGCIPVLFPFSGLDVEIESGSTNYSTSGSQLMVSAGPVTYPSGLNGHLLYRTVPTAGRRSRATTRVYPLYYPATSPPQVTCQLILGRSVSGWTMSTERAAIQVAFAQISGFDVAVVTWNSGIGSGLSTFFLMTGNSWVDLDVWVDADTGDCTFNASCGPGNPQTATEVVSAISGTVPTITDLRAEVEVFCISQVTGSNDGDAFDGLLVDPISIEVECDPSIGPPGGPGTTAPDSYLNDIWVAGAAGTSFTPPGGTTDPALGDLILFFATARVTSGTAPTASPGVGWNLISSVVNGLISTTAWWRVAGASENAATWTVTCATSAFLTMQYNYITGYADPSTFPPSAATSTSVTAGTQINGLTHTLPYTRRWTFFAHGIADVGALSDPTGYTPASSGGGTIVARYESGAAYGVWNPGQMPSGPGMTSGIYTHIAIAPSA